MSGTLVKAAVGAFFIWLSAQLGGLARDLVERARESVQASELLTIDGNLAAWAIQQQRTRPPADQAEFEDACRAVLSARADRDVTLDRWGRAYLYELLSRRPPGWRITSRGPDGRLGTADDLFTERHGDRVEVARDPASIIEGALARKQAFDREALRRLRELSARLEGKEAPPAKGEAPAPAALEAAGLEDLDELLKL